jgi:hypothetical protein
MRLSLRPLNERDLEMLNELVACQESALERMRADYALNIGFAPIEFGGRNGSHHARTALKLVRHGLVEARKRGKEWGDTTTRDARGSNVYRPTPAGVEAVLKWRQEKKA